MATKTTERVATPEMMNAIRSEASPAYQANVPLLSAKGLISEVANPILAYTAYQNEFLSLLVNKIIAQLVYRKLWDNPLAMLKKGNFGVGTDIEELHTNPAIAAQYDGTDTGMAGLLKSQKPDSAPAWYRLNRQDKYKVTINNEQLSNAFLSWDNLEGFIGQIVDSLYNGNTIDEFKYTKQLVSDAYTGNKLPTVTTVMPTNEATGKQFQVAMRNLSMQFTFPSTEYNPYKLMGGTANARTTWSSIDDQVILIRADVAANVGVEVLSAAFNLSYADYLARQIIVDKFDGDGKLLAVLADEKSFQIREKLRRNTEFYNAEALNWQYYFHAWDTFALSPFHNCVALVTE